MNVVALRNSNLPSTYMAAKRALAECARIDQCAEWADAAKAIAAYAKMAEDTELLDQAARIKARAVRRMGELLKEIEPSKGGRPTETRGGASPSSRKAAGDAAGLSDDQRKDAIRVANVPEDEFERMVEGSNPPTVTKLAEIGTNKSRPAPDSDPVDDLVEMSEAELAAEAAAERAETMSVFPRSLRW